MPTTKVSVYIPVEMYDRVEQYCEDNDLSRTEAFRQAIDNELEEHGLGGGQ